VEANALRIDWNDVVPKEKLNYIMGNPPFVGQSYRSKEQADEVKKVFGNNAKSGKLDYVAAWYKKAAEKSAAIFFEKRLAKCETMCYNVTYNDVKNLMR
jgi:methylase of polypeptide subunit release factors